VSNPLDAFMLDHLRARLPGSADPVEVARAFQAATQPDATDPEAWHRHLSAVRRAALRLAGEGHLEILRKGKPVAPAEARGVIRLRLATAPQGPDTPAEPG
jgi:hypothetical protein